MAPRTDPKRGGAEAGSGSGDAEKAALKRLVARYRAALAKRQRWDPLLADAYRFALPQVDTPQAGDRTGPDARRGEKRGTDLFDSTAVDALDERAARTHGQLFPPFQEWLAIQPASETEIDAGQQAEMREAYAEVLEKFHAAIDVSNFHTEIAVALREAYISLGCINLGFGTPDNPLSFEAVGVRRVTVEESADGVPRTVYLTLSVPARDMTARYPDGSLPPKVAELAKSAAEGDKPVEVVEANVWDPERRVTTWSAFTTTPEHLIQTADLAEPRAIAFRVDKHAGEAMGRGPVIKVLPDIKTANKIVELTLKNASIEVTGIWQADDDGVLNVQNLRLAPGTIVTKAVGSAGLQRLDAAGNFDLSTLVLNEIRERIRRAIIGPELPPAEDGIRTAFELGERRADQRAVEVPQTLRLLGELYDRLARRALHILSHPAMAGSRYYIHPDRLRVDLGDGREAKLAPTSPMVRIQDEMASARAVNAFAVLNGQLGPEVVGRKVKLDDFVGWYLEKAGFPAQHIRTPRDIAAMEAAQQEAAGMAAAAQAVAGAADGLAGPAGAAGGGRDRGGAPALRIAGGGGE